MDSCINLSVVSLFIVVDGLPDNERDNAALVSPCKGDDNGLTVGAFKTGLAGFVVMSLADFLITSVSA